MEVLLCERINDLRHRLFHLLNWLITTASELREEAKVTGSKVWTIWRVFWCPYWSNSLWQGWSYGLVHCLDGNATDPIWRVRASSDGISFWTPLNLQHSIPCWLFVQWEPSACRLCQCCPINGSSKVCWWICSVGPSWVWESQHASTGNSVS